jgi:7,8-dihydropterin-6-yl-methyl-4-(beta-D-ribofuranosyl)aminobenzene 5'-phosphate synthase
MSIDPDEDCLHRRHVLCGGGAFMFAAMMASLLESYKPVRAQAITGNVAEVDRVSVRVVVDSYQFAVAAGKKTGSVEVQHFGWGLSADKPPSRTLISEFGLSMHAASKRASETRNLLMDFGFTPGALNKISICWPLTQPSWMLWCSVMVTMITLADLPGSCSKTRAS